MLLFFGEAFLLLCCLAKTLFTFHFVYIIK